MPVINSTKQYSANKCRLSEKRDTEKIRQPTKKETRKGFRSWKKGEIELKEQIRLARLAAEYGISNVGQSNFVSESSTRSRSHQGPSAEAELHRLHPQRYQAQRRTAREGATGFGKRHLKENVLGRRPVQANIRFEKDPTRQ